MKVIVTASELIDKGYWGDYCEETGLSIWCVNEGLMDSKEEITLTDEQSKKWGFAV